MSRLHQSKSIISSNKDGPPLCHACQLGKHVKLPFSDSTTSTVHPFQLLHCDIWTSPIPSNSGLRYYLIIVDDFSHYFWSFSLHRKSDVYATLVAFHAFAKTHFNLPILAIQCDNGGEFLNTCLDTFCVAHGVLLCFSCPHTSQQNGKAERAIRTTNDVIRTLLFQAYLPPSFWAVC
jgi:transposase InsO family protein